MKRLFKLFAVRMAIMSTLAGCSVGTPPPPGLDLSLSKSSDNKLYHVALKPLQQPLVVNKMHSWDVQVTSAKGEPVSGAQIQVDGGMPQHGHGFPTQPRITQELGSGRYLLEGMKYSMTGWWVIKLDIKSAVGDDKITFNTVIN